MSSTCTLLSSSNALKIWHQRHEWLWKLLLKSHRSVIFPLNNNAIEMWNFQCYKSPFNCSIFLCQISGTFRWVDGIIIFSYDLIVSLIITFLFVVLFVSWLALNTCHSPSWSYEGWRLRGKQMIWRPSRMKAILSSIVLSPFGVAVNGFLIQFKFAFCVETSGSLNSITWGCWGNYVFVFLGLESLSLFVSGGN